MADTLPPVELTAPDIGPWQQGNTGVDWVHRFDSGQPGARVLVQALTHGNEICGAIAMDWLLRLAWRPVAGCVTLAFANVQAYARFDPANPFPSRCVDEDFNRVWGDEQLLGPRDSVELRRARALRPFVDEAEFVLDIHSMSEACAPSDGVRHGRQERCLCTRPGHTGRTADRHRPPGRPAHGGARWLQRPGQPQAGAAGGMWPALGACRGGCGHRYAGALSGPYRRGRCRPGWRRRRACPCHRCSAWCA
jgi:hypothetical protein